MIPISSRNKAAVSHLAVFCVVGTVIVAWAQQRFTEDLSEFELSHHRGALVYQIAGLLTFSFLALFSFLPAKLAEPFIAQVILGFFWVGYMCLILIYLLGVVVLSMQAWSGQDFDFGVLNGFVYGSDDPEDSSADR